MTQSLNSDLETLEGSQAKQKIQLEPGSYSIIKAWINYGKGAEYTLTDKILKIYLSESMESFGITGWLDMIDTANLIRNGPIVGQELLYMQFETAGATDAGLKNFGVNFTKQPLAIHKVDSIDELKTASSGRAPQALTYRLHFCSPELLRNDRISISQTMQGSYSDIVKQILKDHLKTTKTVKLQETTDLKQLIIPEMHPFKAINWLTRNSELQHSSSSKVNPFKGKAADFYFYETSRGYKFLPAMHEPKYEIILALGNSPATQRYVNQMTTSITYEHNASADTLQSIPNGIWGSQQIAYDQFNKSVKRYQCSYHRALKKEQNSYVNKTPVFLPSDFMEKNRDAEDKTISDFPAGLQMLYGFSGKRISNVNKSTKEVNYPWSVTPPDLSMRRVMQTFHACFYNTIKARFYGISALEVGMVVKLEMPDIGTGSGQYDKDPIFANRLNNSWIIKQLTHVIDNTKGEDNGYYCDVELANTLRDTNAKGILPSYSGMGSTQFKTPTKSVVIDAEADEEDVSTLLG